MPVKPILIDFGDAEFASVFDEAPVWSLNFGLSLLDRLPLEPGMRILDVGCGAGFPLLTLASMYGPSCKLVGLDVWRAALDHAERKRRYFEQHQVMLTLTDGLRYPFADGAFDLLVCNLGVNNFDNPDASVAEWGRVVRPGGRVAMTSNLVGHMREFYSIFRPLLLELDNPEYLEQLAKNEAHRGTADEHRRQLENAGFEIESSVESQFTLRYLDGTALFSHPLVRMGFLPSWLSIVDEDVRGPLFEELERRLNVYAKAHGRLNLTVPTLTLSAVRIPEST